jgi:hypothetical protein
MLLVIPQQSLLGQTAALLMSPKFAMNIARLSLMTNAILILDKEIGFLPSR